MTLKAAGAFLGLAMVFSSVATAQSADQFNNIVPPSLSYENPTQASLYPNGGKSPIQRLQKFCSSEKPSDRQTCNQAWREINAAYAMLKSSETTTSKR